MIERGAFLYEQTYDALWKKIIEGEITTGQRLGDREWAERLDVSRTPVREAMRQMARDGVLLALGSGGYQVRAVEPSGLRDLYKCRAALEALAARETALRGDLRVVRRIRSLIEKTRRMLDQRDAAGALKNNSNLHEAILEGSGNPHLLSIMGPLKQLILFYRVTLLESSGDQDRTSSAYFAHLERAQTHHIAILKALEEQRADDAAKIMEEHLLATADDMDRLLRQQQSAAGRKTKANSKGKRK